MNKKQYNEWSGVLTEMAKCVAMGDFDKAQSFKLKADSLFESAKREHDFFKNGISNFGLMNSIIEPKIASMFAEGSNEEKKPLVEYVKLVKNDGNLKAQYTFYKAMSNYTSSAPSREYIKESLKDVKKSINEDTIAESNQKVLDFMKKYHITKSMNLISEEKKNFFNSCQFLLENKSNSNILADIYDNIDSVASYIEQTPRQTVKESAESTQSLVDTVNNFNDKYAVLEGSTKNDFSVLLEKVEDTDTPEVKDEKTGKKMKLLNDMKADCLSRIEEFGRDIDKSYQPQIEEMKQLVNSKVYNEATIVKDIADLLAVREQLSL